MSDLYRIGQKQMNVLCLQGFKASLSDETGHEKTLSFIVASPCGSGLKYKKCCGK